MIHSILHSPRGWAFFDVLTWSWSMCWLDDHTVSLGSSFFFIKWLVDMTIYVKIKLNPITMAKAAEPNPIIASSSQPQMSTLYDTYGCNAEWEIGNSFVPYLRPTGSRRSVFGACFKQISTEFGADVNRIIVIRCTKCEFECVHVVVHFLRVRTVCDEPRAQDAISLRVQHNWLWLTPVQ